MGAPQVLSDRFMPKSCFCKRVLSECTSRKRDNIVLIEVDSDDCGDVIILDVPESFQRKFKKKPKLVISIDDDDDDDDGGRDEASNTNRSATSSDSISPTEAAVPSTSAYVGKDVDEGNTPVKLSKSKRTYSGKYMSRNRCGLGTESTVSEGDWDDCLSESDCSDCELMEGSVDKVREQWEKASFRRRHDASCVPSKFGNEACTSAPSHPVHDNAGSPSKQGNARNGSPYQNGDIAFAGYSQKFSEENKSLEQDYDPMEMDGKFTRTSDEYISSRFNDKERSGALDTVVPVHFDAEHFTVQNPQPVGDFSGSTGKHAEEVMDPPQDCDAKTTNEVFDRQQCSQIVGMPSDPKFSYGNEVVSSSGQNDIITDRQKIKETEEYKLALEEELAARKQQLLIQAEEAQRLRNRKKAENMRIMMNERRQKQRVEEIRQSRRKDEENLNLKEKHRVEIKKELRRIEAICSDMASLLRCLGIHVGGGLYPSPNEVQAAYKQACLKFHPDRMSTTDLRQQVEAEEKFKLISNMKDKFCLHR